jgi:stearoyl-CoA desaturase (delta-9 desaturase)
MHHAGADTPADPHDSTRGFWYSHIAWLFHRPDAFHAPAVQRRFAPDVAADSVLVGLNNPWLVYGMQVALFALLWPLLDPAAAFWCTAGRLVFQYHATFLVNSACHRWGYRNYETPDRSTNCWWVALLTLGEGWHNNHHAAPYAAAAGHRAWEFDLSWLVILGLSRLGLAWDVREPHTRTTGPVTVVEEQPQGAT